MVSIFFRPLSCKKMIATVRDENILSWKVIEKVGFILSEKKCIITVSVIMGHRKIENNGRGAR